MKNRIIKQSFQSIGIILLGIIMLSGCVAIRATKTTNLVDNAKLLIMPSRDLVQGGLAHAKGEGSGRQLQQSVQHELNAVSDFNIMLFEANDKFTHTTIIKKEDAIDEAIKLGVDYCLLLTLGEFRNAAPMTFRSDFVILESGVLIDVNTKEEVWTVNKPFMLEKSNVGNHIVLIDNVAKFIAKSIVRK